MKIFYALLLSSLFLVSCSNKFEERSISEFTIDTNALEDGELVNVIYAPGTPDYNKTWSITSRQ